MKTEHDAALRLRTPLGRVRGLGSARGGTHHWWGQRLTSLALLPLTLWFAISAVSLAGATHSDALVFIGAPLNAVLLIATLLLTFHHTNAGLQVVIEDYVRAPGARIAALLAVQAACWLLAIASVLAVLRIAV
ncbi:succinate dehydrogenase, hydrophobic membrane anchor protein [Humitalea sp. 24SJ18S-53]|uniref:succinate dehydrogenase, hydrophobic membrane anchor protein n=1 Tax=Humitalea sp. 24SJ18S-53 TaxID=3422307 RepID=UPI003D678CAD